MRSLAFVLLAACSSGAKTTERPIVAATAIDANPTPAIDAAPAPIEDPRVLVALAAPGWRTRAHVAVAAGAVPHVAPGEPWPGWVAWENRDFETLPLLGEEDDWVLVGVDGAARVAVWIARDQLLPVATRQTPIVAKGAKAPADGKPGAFALPGFVFSADDRRARRGEKVFVDGVVAADDVGWRYEPDPAFARDADGWTWGDVTGDVVDRKGKKGRVVAYVDGFVRLRELGGDVVELLDSPGMVAWDDTVLVRGVLTKPFVPFEGPKLGFNPEPGNVPEGTCLVAGGRLVGVASTELYRSQLSVSALPIGGLPFALDEALDCSQLVTGD